MREWEKYNKSEEYANSFRWAAHEEHRQGSMWAAFMAGFLAANPDGAKPISHADGGQNNEGDLICPDGILDCREADALSNS